MSCNWCALTFSSWLLTVRIPSSSSARVVRGSAGLSTSIRWLQMSAIGKKEYF